MQFYSPEVRRKFCRGCPGVSWIPTVPGPLASARTLTKENSPLIKPKPSPATVKETKIILAFITNILQRR